MTIIAAADLKKALKKLSVIEDALTVPCRGLVRIADGRLRAADTELTLEVLAPIKNETPFAVNLKQLNSAVSNLTADIELTYDPWDGEVLRLKSGRAKFEIPVVSADVFPELPAVNPEASYEVPTQTLMRLISYPLSASEGQGLDVRFPVIEVAELVGTIRVSGTNGVRIGLVTDSNDDPQIFPSRAILTIPLRAAEALAVLDDKAIGIEENPSHLFFVTPSAALIARKHTAEFPSYTHLLERQNAFEVTIQKAIDFANALKDVSGFVEEKRVTVRFADGATTISAQGRAKAEAEVTSSVAADPAFDREKTAHFKYNDLADFFNGAVSPVRVGTDADARVFRFTAQNREAFISALAQA